MQPYFKMLSFFHQLLLFKSSFLTIANFQDTIFHEVAFNNLIFYSFASFNRAVFKSKAKFLKATFNESVEFGEASFNKSVNFSDTIFSGSAGFKSAIFSDKVFFKRTQFLGNLSFDKVRFENDVSFYVAKFQAAINFRHTIFAKEVNFENAQFENVGHFEGAGFSMPDSKIPSFRGCKIDSTLLEFSDDSHFSQNDFSEEAIKNISFLKRLSDEHGQLDQALNFNAMELHAKRKLALKPLTYVPPDRLILCSEWWESLPTGLYGYLSNYGRSFTRPLVAFIILAIMTWVIVIAHAIYNSPPLCKDKQQSWLEELALDGAPCFINSLDNNKTQLHLSGYRAAFEYSVYRTSNLVDFTDTDKQTQAVTQRLFDSQIEPMWMRVYGIFKAILSAILLFLTVLGLRNKYRIS